MSLGSCKLNNKYIRTIRRDEVYQAIVIDLTMLGVINKEESELLLGCSIPNTVTLPDFSRGVLDKDNETTPSDDTQSEDN